MIVSTMIDMPGHRVAQVPGPARGVRVRARSVLGAIGGSQHAQLGGNITAFTSPAEHARQEAHGILVAQAGNIRANAVIVMRYDASEIAGGITEVIACGTAVQVDPIRNT